LLSGVFFIKRHRLGNASRIADVSEEAVLKNWEMIQLNCSRKNTGFGNKLTILGIIK